MKKGKSENESINMTKEEIQKLKFHISSFNKEVDSFFKKEENKLDYLKKLSKEDMEVVEAIRKETTDIILSEWIYLITGETTEKKFNDAIKPIIERYLSFLNNLPTILNQPEKEEKTPSYIR